MLGPNRIGAIVFAEVEMNKKVLLCMWKAKYWAAF